MIKNFLIKKGDQLAFTITFTSATDATALALGVKEKYDDESYIISKSLGNGITKISSYKYQVVITSADTAALDPKNYVYDLRLTIGTAKTTPLSGKIMVKQTVFES